MWTRPQPPSSPPRTDARARARGIYDTDEHTRPGGGAMMRADPPPADAQAIADAKAYLRIAGGDEDALIARLIAVAIGHGESFTGQLLIARSVDEVLAGLPVWQRLGGTPVAAIQAVQSAPIAGDPAALPVDGYAIDIDAAGDGWVRVTAPALPRVSVRYTAGIAPDWSSLPDAIRQGAVRLAAHLYTHRDAADEGSPPAAVAALWRPWRRMRLS
jgi:uncharacterized phiE125 gp8 family phage protein